MLKTTVGGIPYSRTPAHILLHLTPVPSKSWSIDKYEDALKKVDFPEHIAELLIKQKMVLEKSLSSVQSNDETFNQFLRTAN